MSTPTRRFTLVPIEWLKAHEQYVEQRVAELVHHFQVRGAVDYAIVADAKTGTIIDGHHRLEALRRLQAKLAPALLIDYMDPAIVVHTWRDAETPPAKEDVVRHAAEGKLYPPKSTRHDFVRVLDPVDVPLDELL